MIAASHDVVVVPWDPTNNNSLEKIDGQPQVMAAIYPHLPPPPPVIASQLCIGFTLSPNGPVPIFFENLQRLREHIEWLHGVLMMNKEQLRLYNMQKRVINVEGGVPDSPPASAM